MAIILEKPQKQPLQRHQANGYWNGVMDSQADPKTRTSPDAQRKVRVIENEHGHHLLSDTIKTIKLTLMDTGIFFMSEAQQRLMKLREAGIDDASDDLDEKLDFIDDSSGFNPYDSTKK